MRTQDVERSFGNKTTWDRSFDDHFRQYVVEFNEGVFSNGRDNRAFNRDVLDGGLEGADLVYLDPPYYDRTKQNGATNYQFYYYFLEGYLQYSDRSDMIDNSVESKRLICDPSPWTDQDRIYDAFEELFDQFSENKLAVSYNTAGLPTPAELKKMLGEHKEQAHIEARKHQYVLSTAEDSADEVLLIAHD